MISESLQASLISHSGGENYVYWNVTFSAFLYEWSRVHYEFTEEIQPSSYIYECFAVFALGNLHFINFRLQRHRGSTVERSTKGELKQWDPPNLYPWLTENTSASEKRIPVCRIEYYVFFKKYCSFKSKSLSLWNCSYGRAQFLRLLPM